MLSDGKIIYSKRFPRCVSETQCGEADEIDEELPEYSPPSFEEFLQHITENSVYIARFDKMVKKDYFILAAINLSLKYEIDMTVAEYFHYVRVTIYAICSAYTGEIKSIIATLFSMCDKIATFLSKEDPCDFIVCLDYYTHDHYLSGKKMNEFNPLFFNKLYALVVKFAFYSGQFFLRHCCICFFPNFTLRKHKFKIFLNPYDEICNFPKKYVTKWTSQLLIQYREVTDGVCVASYLLFGMGLSAASSPRRIDRVSAQQSKALMDTRKTIYGGT